MKFELFFSVTNCSGERQESKGDTMHPKGRSNQIQVKDLEPQPHFSKCKVDNLANSTMQVSGMMPLLQSASLKIALQLQQVFLVSSGRERGWYVHDTYRVGDIVYWKV